MSSVDNLKQASIYNQVDSASQNNQDGAQKTQQKINKTVMFKFTNFHNLTWLADDKTKISVKPFWGRKHLPYDLSLSQVIEFGLNEHSEIFNFRGLDKFTQKLNYLKQFLTKNVPESDISFPAYDDPLFW